MILYLLKSSLCLLILIFFYHLVLEREKMHAFNRFYLLFSLCFAFSIPLFQLDLGLNSGVLTNLSLIRDQIAGRHIMELSPVGLNKTTSGLILWAITAVYLGGISIFLFRFVKNLATLKVRINTYDKVNYQGVRMVLLNKKTPPHAFLYYIFIHKEDYEQDRLEKELLTHEIAHVKQYHSLDILFIQLLQIVFWFNPLIYFYKKAVKLNHEFLADEFVIKTYDDVGRYQSLLLNKIISARTSFLTSRLNYALAKKRFLMMTKTRSKKRIYGNKIAILPVFLFALAFGAKASVQENMPAHRSTKIEKFVSAESDVNPQVYDKTLKPVSPKARLLRIPSGYTTPNCPCRLFDWTPAPIASDNKTIFGLESSENSREKSKLFAPIPEVVGRLHAQQCAFK